MQLSDEDVLEIEESIFYDFKVVQNLLNHSGIDEIRSYGIFIKMFSSFIYEANFRSRTAFKSLLKEYFDYLTSKDLSHIAYQITGNNNRILSVCNKLDIYYNSLDNNTQKDILDTFVSLSKSYRKDVLHKDFIDNVKSDLEINFIQSIYLKSEYFIETFSLFISSYFLEKEKFDKSYSPEVIKKWIGYMLGDDQFRKTFINSLFELSKDNLSKISILYSTLLHIDSYSDNIFNEEVILKVLLLFLNVGAHSLES